MDNTKQNLKAIVEFNTFLEVKHTINSNQNITDYLSLKERKLKKVNQLKFQPRQA